MSENRKRVRIQAKPTADTWVAQGEEHPPLRGTLKRLTLDIPQELHKAIKLHAVEDGTTMVEMLRTLLEERYGID